VRSHQGRRWGEPPDVVGCLHLCLRRVQPRIQTRPAAGPRRTAVGSGHALAAGAPILGTQPSWRRLAMRGAIGHDQADPGTIHLPTRRKAHVLRSLPSRLLVRRPEVRRNLHPRHRPCCRDSPCLALISLRWRPGDPRRTPRNVRASSAEPGRWCRPDRGSQGGARPTRPPRRPVPGHAHARHRVLPRGPDVAQTPEALAYAVVRGEL